MDDLSVGVEPWARAIKSALERDASAEEAVAGMMKATERETQLRAAKK